MTAAEDRRRPDVLQTARCQRCGRERDGVTHFEAATYARYPVGRPIHFCDDCIAWLAAAERPLEAVIADLVRQ